jgi:hypothetical protein
VDYLGSQSTVGKIKAARGNFAQSAQGIHAENPGVTYRCPMGSSAQHWDDAYRQGDTTRGWYQPHASMSMKLLGSSAVPSTSSIVDIGAGASTFVDGLLAAGFTDITLVDHSPVGLDIAQGRLGDASTHVRTIVADLRGWEPQRKYDVWHDRAVAHFLLDEADQSRYRDTLLAATHPGSFVIIGVFGPDGPPICAGLPVRRFTEADVASLLGDKFEILHTEISDHVRPDGYTQQYLWTLAQRRR